LQVAEKCVPAISIRSCAKSDLRAAINKRSENPPLLHDGDSSGNRENNLALTMTRSSVVRDDVMPLGDAAHQILTRARGDRIFERPNFTKQTPPSPRVEMM
jgi:hypothetical protein